MTRIRRRLRPPSGSPLPALNTPEVRFTASLRHPTSVWEPLPMTQSGSSALLRQVRSLTGRPPQAASPRQWLRAMVDLVREHIGEEWGNRVAAARDANEKRIYYLSMEFLPGRLLIQA